MEVGWEGVMLYRLSSVSKGSVLGSFMLSAHHELWLFQNRLAATLSTIVVFKASFGSRKNIGLMFDYWKLLAVHYHAGHDMLGQVPTL